MAEKGKTNIHSLSQRMRKEIFKSTKNSNQLKESYDIKKTGDNKFNGFIQTYYINEECEATFLKISGNLNEVLKKRTYNNEIFRIIYCIDGECFINVSFSEKNFFYHLEKGDVIFQKGHDGRVVDFQISGNDLKILYFDIYINKFLINLMKTVAKEKVEIFKKSINSVFLTDNIVFWDTDSKSKSLLSKISHNEYLFNLNKFLDFRSDVSVFYNYILRLENIISRSSFRDESHILSEVKNIISKYKVTEIPLLKTISELLDISEYKINSAFDKYEKMSFFQYIQKLKMEYSRNIILNTDKSISEISLEVGYQNPGKFSHIFKRHFGISPLTYRKIHSLSSKNTKK